MKYGKRSVQDKNFPKRNLEGGNACLKGGKAWVELEVVLLMVDNGDGGLRPRERICVYRGMISRVTKSIKNPLLQQKRVKNLDD